MALADVRDDRLNVVRDIIETEPGELIIPAPVTAEVDYLLRSRIGLSSARAFLEDLAHGQFTVQSLTQGEHAVALSIHNRYEDLELGLADLSVIVLAGRHRTGRLLTFDERDFRPVTPLSGGSFALLPADL